MKIKIFILLCLILTFNVKIYSQEDKLVQNTSKLDLILLDPVSSINELIFKKCENKLYFTSKIIEEDSAAFYDLVEIDKSKKLVHYKVIIPLKLKNRIWLKDFEIYNNMLFFNLQYEIAVFKLDSLKNYKYSKSIPKEKILEGIKIIDNIIYGYTSSYDVSKDSTLTFLWTYNLFTNTQQIKFFEDPNGIEWTQIQPRKLIDIFNNRLIISDAKRYKIRIYDINNYELLETIELIEEINNENIDLQKYKKTKDINKVISVVTNKLFDNRTKVDLIESINLISENKIIVIKSIGDSINEINNKYFDIWEKKNNIWERIIKNLVSGLPNKDTMFSYNNMFIGNLLISEDYFISAQSIPFNIDESHFKMKFKDIYKLSEDYVAENDIRYSLLIGKIK